MLQQSIKINVFHKNCFIMNILSSKKYLRQINNFRANCPKKKKKRIFILATKIVINNYFVTHNKIIQCGQG